MKNTCLYVFAFFVAVLFCGWHQPTANVFANGLQPRLSLDATGTTRLVFGRSDSIFYAVASDGATFTTPVFIARVPKMHLGNTRGPQIASSAHYSVVTAMDNAGAVHCYQLNHATGKWTDKGLVNDVPGSAPEGLMGLAADEQDHFYAVWLDVRNKNQNNICFASFSPEQKRWTKNKLLYVSPEGHVCECCRPSISVMSNHVTVMYRNWLHGSRDLYVMTSADGGKTFGAATKLGTGTWKLNGCPMDGGGIVTDSKGIIHTAWQREGTIYYTQPGQPEQAVATGAKCGLAADKNGSNLYVTLQDKGVVKLVDVQSKKETIVGKGSFLNTVMLPDGKMLCVWENDKEIWLRKL